MEKALTRGASLLRSIRETGNYSKRHGGPFSRLEQFPLFDVAMVTFDEAEACKLVGLFLLNEIVEADITLEKESFGLFRDDGLVVTQRSGQHIENMVKMLHAIFNRHCLTIKV